ncbi:MAG: glycine cleavage system protein GcvH [Anaerolineales bacterium]|jgi:glycine cleavage system H protein
MNVPEDLKYTENDEWIRVEGDTATVGISDYAQDQLSDVVYFEVTADAGAQVNKGEVFAVVESVKAASDVYMPVSGEMIEANEALADNPEWVNADPYDKAWMAKVKLTDAGQLDDLMDAAAYIKHCEGREH